MKKALVIGASGATGRLLVKLLIEKGVEVVAIVRNVNAKNNIFTPHPRLQIIEAEISKISEDDLAVYLKECQVVFSCLGHSLNFKGMFGHPRQLVTDAVKKVTKTTESLNLNYKIKIILMNTSGNSNRDIPEKTPLSQKLITFLLRLLLPPHVDNENAADFLRTIVGQENERIEWVAVRPDGLVNEEQVTKYNIHTSPIRNPIFDAGSTSRINVADFMSELAIKKELWDKWKGKMPVIYNDA